MKKLRSVGALLAICGAFSCATATSDGTVSGPNTPQGGAGGDAAGSAGLGEPGGSATTGGSGPQTGGSPGSAGKGEAGKANGGSGNSGGKGGSGTAGSSGKAGSGSGGTGGTGGSSSTGGKAGTGSGGDAGGAVAGSTGTGGSGPAGPCDNPKDVSKGNSGSLETTGPACLRTQEKFGTVGCSNWAGRTLKVNGALVTCPDGKTTTGPFAAAVDGWNYFDISAGSLSYAGLYWY